MGVSVAWPLLLNACLLLVGRAASVAMHYGNKTPSPETGGLTLTRFGNTALAGDGASSAIVSSLEALACCDAGTCGGPSSLLLTGRIAPPTAGNYGFQLTMDPPLPYPSPVAYARLWVHDHLLFPHNTTGRPNVAGGYAPLWIPLPPRALTARGLPVEHVGVSALGSYEIRLEFVCLAADGCTRRTMRLRWAMFAAAGVASTGQPDSPTCRNSSFTPDTGCNGNDLPNSKGWPTATLAECCAACEAEPMCAAATWNGPDGPYHDSRCNLKHSGTCRAHEKGQFFLQLRPDNPLPVLSSEGTAPLSPLPLFDPIPGTVLLPSQGPHEVARRALARRLQTGWGTFYRPSMFTWVLLPESFAVKVGLYQRSTGHYLPPEGLTVNKGQLQAGASFAIKAGMHSYNSTYTQASLLWLDSTGSGINISFATTVDTADGSFLTILVTTADESRLKTNHSDYLLVLAPAFIHGRAGAVHADSRSVAGMSPGLRNATLHLVQGQTSRAVVNASALPPIYLGVDLAGTVAGGCVALSTDRGLSAAAMLAKTAAYREAEVATLLPYGPEWGEVKDAIQTVLMWSFTYDPKEGLVAPEFQYVAGSQGFADPSIDGDTTAALFCWDGSFASYMTSLDALDLALSNLIQIIKMRTSAGFIPSYSAGTLKSRDRSNPPVTAKILYEITKRWGAAKTQWVVELCFDDLLNWNTWMFARRREAPLGLLSWGSDPYPYAPDGTVAALMGNGGGGATLESGLDNGPMYEGLPFNRTGLYVQDEYDAGYTGLFLMDCQAQIQLARMIGREDAAATLRARFDTVNTAMLATLWNESAGYFQNKRSQGLAPLERMAPTNFYPLLVGPAAGPSEEQARATVMRHLTNPARFGVWPSAEAPIDHPPPPPEARPLVQWFAEKCARGYPCPNSPHVLCCQQSCNREQSFGNLVQRLHSKIRYEGIGLATAPAGINASDLVPLYDYKCVGPAGNLSDLTMGPVGWKPVHGGPCVPVAPNSSAPGSPPGPSLYVHKARTGPSAGDLVPLEVWYRPGDHYLVASEAGRADAVKGGYTRVAALGFVYPAPGTENATSRYGLPSISKDDPAYKDQDYWHGRVWSPMIQITYWALSQYRGVEARGATAGLVAQSRALLLKEWRGYAGNGAAGSFAGLGRNVFENYGADTGDGYATSSSAEPLYSWGGLAGFIGLQANGFYDPFPADPADGAAGLKPMERGPRPL